MANLTPVEKVVVEVNIETVDPDLAFLANEAKIARDESVQSASEALASATGASVSEANALEYAVRSEVAETGAKASEISASNSASTATTKAGEALQSASIATSAKEGAETARDESVTASEVATTQAGIATAKASEASQSASDALASKNASAGSATSASASATNAGNSATSASNSASQASDSATNAETSATNASESATTATNKASEASASATSASNAATTATTQANRAESEADRAEDAAERAELAAVTPWDVMAFMYGYEQETINVLKYAFQQGYKPPSHPYLSKLDGYIKDLKAYNLWGRKDLVYWFAGDGDLNFKTINIVNPNSYKGTPRGGLINTLQGIEGNSLDAYISTSFNLSSNPVNYKYLSAGKSLHVYKQSTLITVAGSVLLGSGTSPAHGLYNTDTTIHRINASNGAGGVLSSVADLRGVGYKAINRLSDTEVILYNELVEIERTQNASSNVNPVSQNIFRGAGGTNNGYSDAGLSAVTLGAQMIGQDAINDRLAIINNL